jgi:hypothetical protein
LPKPRRVSITKQIRAIRKSVSTIDRALRRLTPLLRSAQTSGLPGASRRGRKLKLSPERRAALKLQGQYMGYLRGLKPAQKAKVKAARVAKGLPGAIRLARKLAGA